MDRYLLFMGIVVVLQSDTPRHKWQGFLVQRGGLPLYPHRYSRRDHLSPGVRLYCYKPVLRCPRIRSKQRNAPVASRHLAVRRECTIRRGSTLALALFPGKHGRVFTSHPSCDNPYTIQLSRYYRIILLQGTKRGNAPHPCAIKGTIFHPLVQTQGLSNPRCCKRKDLRQKTTVFLLFSLASGLKNGQMLQRKVMVLTHIQ